MDQIQHIHQLAESHLKDASQFIVDVIVLAKKLPKRVLIIVDGDQGITIDDCADISREVSAELDKSNLLGENYVLEVSTPGLDHPLKLTRQYYKNKGRKVRVKTSDETVEGLLTDVTENDITLIETIGAGKKKEEKTHVIPFVSIEKTLVLVSFK